MNTVAIAGVGLLGGSFALAIREAGFQGTILGVSSPATIERACVRGIIDRGVSLEEAAQTADLVLLAQPIRVILDTLPKLAPMLRQGALVTDVGSTKRQIVAMAEKHLPSGAFLGGHPMAGKESRGLEHAEAGLFQGRTYLLTPSGSADPEFLNWIKAIGATPVIMTPDEHDRTVAFSSHLPQLLSTALANVTAAHLDCPSAAGPGLASMLRLSGSSFEIWRDILDTNQDQIQAALGRFLEEFQGYPAKLASTDFKAQFEAAAAELHRITGLGQ